MPRPIRQLFLLSCFMTILGVNAHAAQPKVVTALVLPLEIDSTQVPEHSAFRHHFIAALTTRYPGKLYSSKAPKLECSDKDCALPLAKTAKTDQVFYGSVRSLGLQLFFKAALMDADGKNAYSQLITVNDPGEIESAAYNMVEALMKHEPAKPPTRGLSFAKDMVKDAAKGMANNFANGFTRDPVNGFANDLAKEDPGAMDRPARMDRESTLTPGPYFYGTGASLGYAPPLGANYGRWKFGRNCNNAIVACADSDLVFQKITGVKLGWNNWLELSDHMALEIDMLWYAPIALGADLNAEYVFTKMGVSPFAGAGIGGHYVYADEGGFEDGKKRNFGTAVNMHGGLILFRGGAFNIVARGQYHMIFNSDHDKGLSADIGIRSQIGGRPDNYYGRTSMTTWGGLCLGTAFFIALALGLADG